MSESYVQVTEGSGKKLHAKQRTIGANIVEDEVVVFGEQYLPTYRVRTASISLATANSHLIELMAGATLKLRIRRILVAVSVPATASNTILLRVQRLSTAGTGGSAQGIPRHDTSNPAAGATAMTLPTAKGTIGDLLIIEPLVVLSTHNESFWRFEPHRLSEAIVVPSGTSNGLAIENLSAVAGASVVVSIEFAESSF